MIHPVFVLAIGRIEIRSLLKMPIQGFDGGDSIELKIAIAFLASGFGETSRLPADQHNLISGSGTHTIRAYNSRQRFAIQRNATSFFIFGCLPELLCDFFE